MQPRSFCPTGERQLTAYLENRLQAGDRDAFREHANTCEICSAELALWDQLESLPAPGPSPRFRTNFNNMLAAERPHQSGRPWLPWAAAALFAVGGFFAGNYSASERRQPPITELRGELRNLRGLVATSLLQQQSAVQRLRGVSYSVALDNPDEDVVASLVQTLRSDSSVDVRLAATDALKKYSDRPIVRQAFIEALALQGSPLVQIALIDAMVDFREGRAAGAFKSLASDTATNPAVKTRIATALEELKVQ